MWAGGAISHGSALEMQELCDILSNHIWVTVPAERNPRKQGCERFHVFRKTYPCNELTYYEGVPVVRAHIAIVQAMRVGEDPPQLRLAVENATARGLLLKEEVTALRKELG